MAVNDFFFFSEMPGEQWTESHELPSDHHQKTTMTELSTVVNTEKIHLNQFVVTLSSSSSSSSSCTAITRYHVEALRSWIERLFIGFRHSDVGIPWWNGTGRMGWRSTIQVTLPTTTASPPTPQAILHRGVTKKKYRWEGSGSY